MYWNVNRKNWNLILLSIKDHNKYEVSFIAEIQIFHDTFLFKNIILYHYINNIVDKHSITISSSMKKDW